MKNETIISCADSKLVNILQIMQHKGMSKTKIIAASQAKVHIRSRHKEEITKLQCKNIF